MSEKKNNVYHITGGEITPVGFSEHKPLPKVELPTFDNSDKQPIEPPADLGTFTFELTPMETWRFEQYIIPARLKPDRLPDESLLAWGQRLTRLGYMDSEQYKEYQQALWQNKIGKEYPHDTTNT